MPATSWRSARSPTRGRRRCFPLVETALQITLDAGSVLGETVVVLGLGVVGALTALTAPAGGGPGRRRRAPGVASRCRRPGSASLRSSPDALATALSADGLLRIVPLVVEVSGNPDALRSALGLLAHEGTVLVASWYGDEGGVAAARRRLPPPPADDPQHAGVDHPRRSGESLDAERRRRRAVVDLLAELPLDRARHRTRSRSTTRATPTPRSTPGTEGLIHVALGYR